MYCRANPWQQAPELEVALNNPIKINTLTVSMQTSWDSISSYKE